MSFTPLLVVVLQSKEEYIMYVSIKPSNIYLKPGHYHYTYCNAWWHCFVFAWVFKHCCRIFEAFLWTVFSLVKQFRQIFPCCLEIPPYFANNSLKFIVLFDPINRISFDSLPQTQQSKHTASAVCISTVNDGTGLQMDVWTS